MASSVGCAPRPQEMRAPQKVAEMAEVRECVEAMQQDSRPGNPGDDRN